MDDRIKISLNYNDIEIKELEVTTSDGRLYTKFETDDFYDRIFKKDSSYVSEPVRMFKYFCNNPDVDLSGLLPSDIQLLEGNILLTVYCNNKIAFVARNCFVHFILFEINKIKGVLGQSLFVYYK